MHRPFHRVYAMMAAISAVMANLQFQTNMAARKEALDAIGPYRSRGKGMGRYSTARSAMTVAQDKRDAKKARNRLRNKRAHRGART